MKTGKIRNIAALAAALLAALIVFAALPALADSIGYISGVKLTEGGRLTWDDYPEAVDYWLGINGGFTPVRNGESITDRFDEAGTYALELEAYTENGETQLAEWKGEAEYDGSKLTLTWSEPDPAGPTPEADPADSKEQQEKETKEPGTFPDVPAKVTDIPGKTEAPDDVSVTATPRPEPDLPQPSATSVLILIGYIVLGLLLIAAVIAIIVLVVVLVRRKKK